ncbi:hypothetical protein [Serinicoccus profundi]|uniref:hypothetical protein n=1 Tax=Serinicoccus profundi TaxID=1078471 RepID=UPI000255F7AD|nr:hypothetical protein [Serinicoccus profundi]
MDLPGWLTGSKVVGRSSSVASATDGALTWTMTQDRRGVVTLEVLSRGQFVKSWHPHLTGLVLHEPAGAILPDRWSASEVMRFSDVDGAQREVSANWLVFDNRENLRREHPWRCELPVSADRISALFFGSLTDHCWLENAVDHAWIVRYESNTSLFSWTDHIGSTPTIRSSTVVVAEDRRIRLQPTGERPWPR